VVIIVSLINLQQLKAGELTSASRLSQQQEPIIRLKISADLIEFPIEVLNLADCLEVLDLSDNHLSALPDDLDQLINLRILFLSNNDFEKIPSVLARCPKLEMISFKSNALTTIDEEVLPIDTRWLILTDNRIEKLPNSMGQLHRLQKLALAGNRLIHLPESMANCKNIELVRLSANQLTVMPDWLFQLPKLAWLAFSGNKFNCAVSPIRDVESKTVKLKAVKVKKSVVDVALADIQLAELLGEGASGLIYRGDWLTQPHSLMGTDNHIAVKIFKGAVTSDGYPQDELDCCLRAGEQENLIKVIATLDQTDTEKKLGLVMELIPASFHNLGLPPSLITCTRDTFNEGTVFDAYTIVKIAAQMANAMSHLHENGISHGDVYAHNTMINDHADILLGDFGAATNLTSLPKSQKKAMEHIEVRAFGCLLDDLLGLNKAVDSRKPTDLMEENHVWSALVELKSQCLSHDFSTRLSFKEIQTFFQGVLHKIKF
jgi:tRNA A-37 threonylcarbamoyl transferase component Bud32